MRRERLICGFDVKSTYRAINSFISLRHEVHSLVDGLVAHYFLIKKGINFTVDYKPF